MNPMNSMRTLEKTRVCEASVRLRIPTDLAQSAKHPLV